MIAKISFIASLCFAFFIMPRFWQHDTHFSAHLSNISIQTDSIVKKRHLFLSSEIDRAVSYSFRGSKYKRCNDTFTLYLGTFNAFLDKKISKVNQNKSLYNNEIDSINTLKTRLLSYALNCLDQRDIDSYKNKFSTFIIPKTDSKLSAQLQNIRLRQFKQCLNEGTLPFKAYFLEESSIRRCFTTYPTPPYRVDYYTKIFEEKLVNRNALLTTTMAPKHTDSVWVNGILGKQEYLFTPRKTGYHYFCVKAKMIDKQGAAIVLRDTFKVHITK